MGAILPSQVEFFMNHEGNIEISLSSEFLTPDNIIQPEYMVKAEDFRYLSK